MGKGRVAAASQTVILTEELPAGFRDYLQALGCTLGDHEGSLQDR
ncbi:MAG: hypothetical protein QW057_02345 [Candidatus Bathyarchaeia archaeon]